MAAACRLPLFAGVLLLSTLRGVTTISTPTTTNVGRQLLSENAGPAAAAASYRARGKIRTWLMMGLKRRSRRIGRSDYALQRGECTLQGRSDRADVDSSSSSSRNTIDETESNQQLWVVSRGVRYALPYYRTDEHRAKQCVEGLLIHHALCTMFTNNHPELQDTFWKEKVRTGDVEIRHAKKNREDPWNFNVQSDDTYTIQRGDTLRVRHHIHEKCIAAGVPTVISPTNDSDFLVVDKPAGVPIVNEVNGRNSVMFMAERMAGKRLFYAHRLDAPVSGVLVLAKSKMALKKAQAEIVGRTAQKTYIARVLGRFPKGKHNSDHSNEIVVDSPLSFDKRRYAAYINASGRASSTSFRLIRYIKEDNTSLVECSPRTGRQHQIRAHLMHIGHPIANDIAYGGKSEFVSRSVAFPSEDVAYLRKSFAPCLSESCPRCLWVSDVFKGRMEEEEKPEVRQGIWLHALRYVFPSLGRTYEAAAPAWATVLPDVQ